jgi:quercetin dioxygenase-like cupin family protein
VPVWKVVPAADNVFAPADGEFATGLDVAKLVGSEDGAVHLEVSLMRLDPGGHVVSHLHPFEESFYVLEGAGIFTVGDQAYRVQEGSFGFAPIRTPHRWVNDSDVPLLGIRTRSPQARQLGSGAGTYAVTHVVPDEIKPADVADRTRRFVGQFEEDHMPEPGPIQMKGLRSPAARNVAVWMLVDEVIGAVHHTLFQVRFDTAETAVTLGGQHFHPFEETYYITEGDAVAHLEDESIPVGPGDLIFAGVNALHGFSGLESESIRWIEMQAPNPPTSNAFFFKSEWDEV